MKFWMDMAEDQHWGPKVSFDPKLLRTSPIWIDGKPMDPGPVSVEIDPYGFRQTADEPGFWVGLVTFRWHVMLREFVEGSDSIPCLGFMIYRNTLFPALDGAVLCHGIKGYKVDAGPRGGGSAILDVEMYASIPTALAKLGKFRWGYDYDEDWNQTSENLVPSHRKLAWAEFRTAVRINLNNFVRFVSLREYGLREWRKYRARMQLNWIRF